MKSKKNIKVSIKITCQKKRVIKIYFKMKKERQIIYLKIKILILIILLKIKIIYILIMMIYYIAKKL